MHGFPIPKLLSELKRDLHDTSDEEHCAPPERSIAGYTHWIGGWVLSPSRSSTEQSWAWDALTAAQKLDVGEALLVAHETADK